MKEGLSLRDTAKLVGRSHSTLVRELKRNKRHGRAYLPCLAQKRAERVGHNQRWKAPLKEATIFLYVREHLRRPFFWSPEQIAGRLPKEHPGLNLDKETIYRYVYHRRNRKEKLWRYLTLGRRRRRKWRGRRVKRERIKGAVSIDLRPKEVGDRITPGHWESDDMEGVVTDKTALCVSAERVSRSLFLTRLPDQTAVSKRVALVKRFSRLPVKARLSLTVDNGPENADHRKISRRLKLPVYFCHAYHSWEKGTVENSIGRVRRFFPKGESLEGVTEAEVTEVEQRLNTTPRKCLDFLTPEEVLTKLFPDLSSS